MAKVPFTASARTAKLIGQENFANAEGAIIELVKNAYDADAKTAIIVFDNDDKSKEQSSLYIIDNGHGMTEEIVREKWMQIGTDDKLQNFTSEGGRVKTGAKGIGRFALDRLGGKTQMLTTSKENKQSLFWSVDWRYFEVIGLSLNDVNAQLRILKNFNIPLFLKRRFEHYPPIKNVLDKTSFETGTVLKISILKDDWEQELNSLFNNLEVLIPPIEQPEFDIYLFSTNTIGDFGKVNTAYYDDYDYKVSAKYLDDEEKSLKVTITRNELDLEKLENSYHEIFENERMKKFPYNLETFKSKKFTLDMTLNDFKGFSSIDKELIEKIGKFEFTFYFLKNLTSDNKDEKDIKTYPYRSFSSATRRAWLKKFGGVKIFRDDFRVRPYGEDGDDWLKLGERQAVSPQGAGQRLGGYRIRPNQIAGTVKISRIDNYHFNDKSGREGIQENYVFELFKNLLKDIINLFERDRNIIMVQLKELSDRRDAVRKAIEQAENEAKRILEEKEQREKNNELNTPTTNDENVQKLELLASALQYQSKESEIKETEIQLLRSLASVGLIMSSSAHELTSLRNRMIGRTDDLSTQLKKHLSEKTLSGINKQENPFYLISLIREEDSRLKHWLDYSLNSLKKDKRKRININFGDYFETFQSTWKKSLSQRGISLQLLGSKDTSNTIQAFEVDLDVIFNNLLTNSFEALKRQPTKQVNISWKKTNDFIQIDFIDTGRGLAKEFQDNPFEIFNAFETSKRDNRGNQIGTGLGLYIVKSTIDDYNDASIKLLTPAIGFGLRLNFPFRKN